MTLKMNERSKNIKLPVMKERITDTELKNMKKRENYD